MTTHSSRPSRNSRSTEVAQGGVLNPLWALVERAAAMGVHTGLSILVGLAYVRRKAAWWWAALGVHFTVNPAGSLLGHLTGNTFLTEVVADDAGRRAVVSPRPL